jgi:hypothetical protein
VPHSPHAAGLDDAQWTPIDDALRKRGVPQDLRDELRSRLLGTSDGLLLYGSWARGDADADSDLDVLALNYKGVAPPAGGGVSIALYTDLDLSAASGTLFGYHLVRDGRIIIDERDRLATVLSEINPPAPGTVIARIRSLAAVLDVPPADRAEYIEGLTQVARYLLRSAMYAEALDQNQPCFSVREIAERVGDPSLAVVLSSHKTVRPPASDELFDDLLGRLTATVGELDQNPYGDLHGLIEATWETNRDLSNFGTLALSKGEDDLPYDELPKVIL